MYQLTDTATGTCTLVQPTISFLTSTGVTVKQAALAGAPASLVMKSAGTASFVVSDESCSAPALATQLVVTIAGSSGALALTGQYQVCAPTVTPLSAG
jgi:hypothetical protein